MIPTQIWVESIYKKKGKGQKGVCIYAPSFSQPNGGGGVGKTRQRKVLGTCPHARAPDLPQTK